MNLLKLLIITILAIAIGGCGSAAYEKISSGEKTDNPSVVKDDTADKKDDSAKKEDADAESSADDSPTQAVTEFAEAFKAKDISALKKRFSKKSLEDMEKGAKQMKTSLDDQLKNFVKQAQLPFNGVPEMRNEEIKGDSATLEVETEKGWDKIPLVKEDGIWKIAFEKGKQ